MHAAVVASDNRKRLSSAEALRIAELPVDKYDIIGVPLHKSKLQLNIPGLEWPYHQLGWSPDEVIFIISMPVGLIPWYNLLSFYWASIPISYE